jgi:hypothetical protein
MSRPSPNRVRKVSADDRACLMLPALQLAAVLAKSHTHFRSRPPEGLRLTAGACLAQGTEPSDFSL